ncbi:MAG: hypothetical protein N3G80_02940 [Candidatus Micrarchaeota archaeon]|nr:hypothetical protein [Candidatus Micrarchaeota archaeon]
MGRLSFVLAFFILLSFSFSASIVAINSHDGRDVLSGIFYAAVKGMPVRFMSQSSSPEIFVVKIGSNQAVFLIQSADAPISGLVESELRAQNNQVELFQSTDGGKTNLELAKLSGADSFIIVDASYSDSAISVLPYAYAKKAYVILANSDNLEEVKKIVSGKKIILYGYLENKVLQELSPLASKRIGKGEDKYEDNVALVREMLSEYPAERLIMSDGASIEDGMVGPVPILLSGRLVPQVTYDFLKEQVKAGKVAGVLLIGQDLINPVYDMRERMRNEFAQEGISKSMSVLVKFAQALPATQSGTLALDVFILPAYKPNLSITDVFYDSRAKKVMVGLENSGSGPLYFNAEVKIRVNGADFKIFGQPETTLIERGQSFGLEYPLDLSSVLEGNITATVLVKFGSSKRSLEEFRTFTGNLLSVEYVDKSNLSVRNAKYFPEKQTLSVSVKNNAQEPAFFFVQLTLVDESNMPMKITAASIRQIEPYSMVVEEFPLQLSQKELELNKEIAVSVDYGARRGFLTKKATYSVQLEIEKRQAEFGVVEFALLAALAIVVVAAVYFLFFKKEKRRRGS